MNANRQALDRMFSPGFAGFTPEEIESDLDRALLRTAARDELYDGEVLDILESWVDKLSETRA